MTVALSDICTRYDFLTRTDMVWLLVFWIASTIWAGYELLESRDQIREELKESVELTARATSFSSRHTKNGNTFYHVNYAYVGTDGMAYSGESDVPVWEYKAIENTPARQMTLQILQDKDRPSITASKEELKVKSEATDEETIAKAAIWGMLLACLMLIAMRVVLAIYKAMTCRI
jgi:hypothetical protein